MRRLTALVLCALALLTHPVATAQPRASAPAAATTIAPARLSHLLAQIDTDRPGLEAVRTALRAGNEPAAAAALVAYYRARPAPSWLGPQLTAHAPDADDDAATSLALAEAALGDTFTFQGVTGRAPRLPQGGLDWTHRGPRDDMEWALFFNRHFLLLPLLRAHQSTQDPRFAAYANATLSDWVQTRPVENLAHEREMSAAWRPMSSASRLLQAWPHAFFGFRNAPGFSDQTLLLMLASIPEQAAHLTRYHRERHNHTIKEMAGLAHAGAVWPEFREAATWRAYGLQRLGEELDRQFYPDGVHQELSAHYHRSALQYFVWVKDFEAASGRPLPPAFAERLERAADYLAVSMSPQGFGPLNNNGDLDDNRARVMELAERFGRADWQFIASGGQTGTPPAAQHQFYPWAGQAIFRSDYGQNAVFALFDVGPWGAAHQHNDKLNLTLSGHGRALLVDGGRYRYRADDPMVQYLRSSAGHNVLLIDGAGQRPDAPLADAPLTAAFFTAPQATIARGSFTAGFEGIDGQASHHRAVVYLQDGLMVVVDRLETDRPRRITAHWRFAPDLTVRTDGHNAVSTDPGLGNLRIQPVGLPGVQLDLVRGREEPTPLGWTSPDYNQREAATVAVYSGPIQASTTFAWILHPARGTPEAVQARLLRRARSDSPDTIRLQIRRPGAAPQRLVVRLAGPGAALEWTQGPHYVALAPPSAP